MVEILDSNFDYKNSVDFFNKEEFTVKYGEDFYKDICENFENIWYATLGDAIHCIGVSGCFHEAINEAYAQKASKDSSSF